MTPPPSTSLDHVRAVRQAVMSRAASRTTCAGRDDVIELVLVALLADGHVLLEDYPGSGKTTLAKALGDSIVDDLARRRHRRASGASSSPPTCCPPTSPA